MSQHTRQSHFLGTKLRALRKRNGLTLEELSARCIQQDPQKAPSVSYLSMIESGKRVPSAEVLELLSALFQRESKWFLDNNPETDTAVTQQRGGGAAAVPLEPAFLFSKELLQAAIPELLAQTGTTGQQFAHLLIRSHQEMSRNDFPDLERAAENVGQRQFPLDVEDLMRLCRHHGLKLHWFDRKPVLARDKDRELRSMVRSFYEAPNTIYLNRALESDPARLKFDIASHLGHKILHDGDGLKAAHATGGEMGGSPEGTASGGMSPQDVLHAWRDFECSFFAGALLCPKVPFRRFLTRESYRIEAGEKIELTPAAVMRRITKVSPYPYWHFFDAYPPGLPARRVPRQRHPAALGQHGAGERPLPELGGVPDARRDPRGRSRFADFSAARRRSIVALLLPLAAHRGHGGQSARAVGGHRPGAGAALAHARCRQHRRGDHRGMPAPPRPGQESPQPQPRRSAPWRGC